MINCDRKLPQSRLINIDIKAISVPIKLDNVIV